MVIYSYPLFPICVDYKVMCAMGNLETLKKINDDQFHYVLKFLLKLNRNAVSGLGAKAIVVTRCFLNFVIK